MQADRYEKLLRLLGQAREVAPEERRSFLETACGGDGALAAEVDSLLIAGESSDSELNTPALGASFSIDHLLAALEIDSPARQFGNYRILHVLGRGGMGIVYKAEQQQPRRDVALKLIRAELASPKLLSRLKYEGEILARLRHTGIAQVYEAGVVQADHGQQSFVAMELVDGKPITAYAESSNLSQRHRVELLIRVCEAVQYAHQQSVIHRDLKPANILVDLTGQPKIVDFGVARMTDWDLQYTTMETDIGEIVGTLQYMSPEQARGDSLSVDTRTDIYALGVIAYELLAERPPYSLKGKMLPEAALLIQQADPPRLGTINRAFKGDIEIIVGKAMAKEKEARYASAADLSEDFRRCLNNEPIAANGLGLLYHARKFGRRNRSLVSSAIAIIVILVVGLVLASSQAIRATRAEKLAAERGEMMRRELYGAEMMLASEAVELPGGIGRASELVGHWANSTPDLRGWEWYYLSSLCHADLLTYRGHGCIVWSLAWANGADLIASGGDDGVIRIWRADTGNDVLVIRAHYGAVRGLAWSPDNKRIASQGEDRTVKIWDAQNGKKLIEIPCHRDGTHVARALAWSPDGKQVAATDDAFSVKIWNALDGSEHMTLRGHTKLIQSVAWSPDGSRLLSASVDGTVRIWDAETGTERLVFADHHANVRYAAWSPDGAEVASSGDDTLTRVWNSVTGKERLNYRAHAGSVTCLAWSPDGTSIASTCRQDSLVKLWDLRANKELATFRGHGAGALLCVVWDEKGTRLASCGEDGTTKVWAVARPSGDLLLKGHTRNIQSVAWSTDGQRLVSGGYDKSLRIWDASTGALLQNIQAHNGQVASVAFSPDSARVLSGGDDHTVKCWDAASGKLVFALTSFKGTISSVSWSPDGKHFTSSGLQDPVQIWNADGQESLSIPGSSARIVSWNGDGTRLAGAGDGHVIHIWDSTTGREAEKINTPLAESFALGWSPDGTRIAAGFEDGTARIFDVANGKNLLIYRGHTSGILALAWSPDGSRIATACREQTLQIWNPQNGAELLVLHGHDSPLAWSLDGRILASEVVGNILELHTASLRGGNWR